MAVAIEVTSINHKKVHEDPKDVGTSKRTVEELPLFENTIQKIMGL